MYKIPRLNLIQKEFGKTYQNLVGDGWRELKDSDIWEGCERVNDDVLKHFNMKWISDPFKTVYEITEGPYYTRNKYRDPRLKRLVKDLEKGLYSVDNAKIDPNYADKTHLLLSLSRKDEYLAYSKHIDGENRLTYKVFKPILQDDGKYKITIELNDCLGHRFDGREYSDGISNKWRR